MKTPLTHEEIQAYRRRLEAELAKQARAVESIEKGTLEPSGAVRFQPIDESIEETGLEGELDELDVRDRLGYELREALARIEAGGFGRCEGCGGRIPRTRLDVLPHARFCAPCAAAREGAT
jgi:RNA polymerase-binding transcription factor DksA